MSALLQAALDYAGRGLAVFPLIPGGKDPAVKRGFYAATANPETIRRYWRATDRNVGIRTGAASGFWVLDVDQKEADGEASLRALEAKHDPLPKTYEVITGSGGRHLWFRYEGPIACSAGRVGAGLDVRGDGGYIVAPPSVHPCGRAYVWSVDATDVLASAPQWLVLLTRKRPTISQRAIACMRSRSASNGQPGAYGQAALEREIEALANTPRGQRNHALNRASFSLHQLVAGGELDEAEVQRRLIEATVANGLFADPADGPRKVIATIRSGARAGLQHPRTRPGAA